MDELGPCNSFGTGLNLQELAYVEVYIHVLMAQATEQDCRA